MGVSIKPGPDGKCRYYCLTRRAWFSTYPINVREILRDGLGSLAGPSVLIQKEGKDDLMVCPEEAPKYREDGWTVAATQAAVAVASGDPASEGGRGSAKGGDASGGTSGDLDASYDWSQHTVPELRAAAAHFNIAGAADLTRKILLGALEQHRPTPELLTAMDKAKQKE